MATTHGSAAGDLTSKPWAYIAIPVGIVIFLGLTAVVLHTRRQKLIHKRRLHYVGSNPHARRALERDLQEAWMRGAPQERRGLRRWSRRGRWAWASNLLSVRGEEGLNEFGEAPPPYVGKIVEEEGTEMDDRSGRAGGSGSRGGRTSASGSSTVRSVDGGEEDGDGRGRDGHAERREVGGSGMGDETTRRTTAEDETRRSADGQQLPPAYGKQPAVGDEMTGRTSPIAEPAAVLVPGSRPGRMST